MNRTRTIVAVTAATLIGMAVAAMPALAALRAPQSHETPASVATTPVRPVVLPQCDDDRPGQPVTGPCWLADDDQVAVFPYPYAPVPWYILSQ